MWRYLLFVISTLPVIPGADRLIPSALGQPVLQRPVKPAQAPSTFPHVLGGSADLVEGNLGHKRGVRGPGLLRIHQDQGR